MEENRIGFVHMEQDKGSGKTFLACCLGDPFRRNSERQLNLYGSRVSAGGKGKFQTRAGGAEIGFSVYMNCDLLVLDDLGSEKQSEWADQELFRLIDHRANDGKPVIITSNVPMEALKMRCRISSRLGDMCVSVAMPEIKHDGRKRLRKNTKKFCEKF